MNYISRIFISTALILLIAGCSGGGDQPVIPADENPATQPAAQMTDSSRVLWGYWQCELDLEKYKLNCIPARASQLHVNVTNAINKNLGLSIDINTALTDPTTGLFVLTIGLNHPFPSPKLTGFDVRGILITTAGETSGDINLPGEDDAYMVNPDGYTRWWNPDEFPVPGILGYTPGLYGKEPPPGTPLNSTINPYKQFAEVLMKSSPIQTVTYYPPYDKDGRGVFHSGSTNEREYYVTFPTVSCVPKVYFNYAIDASWSAPVEDPPEVPVDFPPEANAPEAFYLETKVTDSNLWTVEGTDLAGGELELQINCWDWQGLMDDYTGEIGPLVLFSPDCVFETGIEPEVEEKANGMAVLTATVEGTPSESGNINIWVGVTAPGTSYKQLAAPAPDEPMVAFSKVVVEVGEPGCENNGNNDCLHAEALTAQDEATGILCLSEDNQDWYNFVVPDNATADGTIHLTGWEMSDLDLYLMVNCPGDIIMSSTTEGTDDEQLNLDDLPEGDYYVAVHAPDDGDTDIRPYKLTLDITGIGSDCTLDDNNDPDDAIEVNLNSQNEETVCLVGDPSDWYTFEISLDNIGYGSIHLNNNSFADNNIYLYDEGIGSPIMSGNKTGPQDEELTIDVLEAGTYYLRVEAKGVSPEGDRPFELILDLDEIEGACDNSDGNNTPDDAWQITTVAVEEGTTCFPSDPDWFVFDVGSEEDLEGDIILESFGLSDNNLELYFNVADDPIGESSEPGLGDEMISVNELGEGTYYIKVTAGQDPGGVDQEYRLATNLHPVTISPVDFWLHVHIVRTSEGTNPATTEDNVNNNVSWANAFYSEWINGSVNISEISYVDNTQWLSLTTSEATTMFNEYGLEEGGLNVFYVNDTPDMPGAAGYSWMDCQFIFQDYTTGVIVMTDFADDAVLAHELGHGVGLLADMYLLDFYTCEEITYCPTGPSDIFCLESDAAFGNLMYWPVGSNIDDYFISDTDIGMSTPEIDSQAENFWFFHTNYPDAFFKP